jgi:nucleoid DNA-binding protein
MRYLCSARISVISEEEGSMATKKQTATKSGGGHKPIKDALGKAGLVDYISNASGVASRDVRAVLVALEAAAAGSVHKNGVGTFVLPGLLKITAVKVPAKPKRKGINPFTKEEQWFAAKPATTKIKVRPLKRLKDAAV